MSTTLDMERIAKELGAERRGKVSAHGGYFGALQLAAEVASRSRVSESPRSLKELLRKEIGKIARKEVQDQVRELKRTVRQQRDAIARLEKQIGSTKAKAAKASKAPAGDKTKQPRIAPNTIKKYRKRLKLSQAELGKLLNVSTSTILRWESGKSKPRSKHLPELAQLRSMILRDVKEQLDSKHLGSRTSRPRKALDAKTT